RRRLSTHLVSGRARSASRIHRAARVPRVVSRSPLRLCTPSTRRRPTMADRMLTKDERHMLSAALGVLRANVLDQPGRRRGQAGPTLYEALLRLDIAEDYGRRIEARAAWAIMLADALRLAAWPYPCRRPKYQRRAERILRARLALAIRAVLRA